MLEAIRKRTGSIVVKGLAGLLIISFGAWGVGDFIQGGISEDVVAEVGNIEISPFQVETQITRELNKLQQQSGLRLDRQQLKAFGLSENIIQGLITKVALDLEVKKMGLLISEELVATNIRNNPLFGGLAGDFDRDRFNQMIRANGFTENNFIDEVTRDLGRGQLLSSFASIKFPSKLAQDVFKIENQKRTMKTFKVTDLNQIGIPKASDTKIREFFEKNKEMFINPETRDISYLYLSIDQVAPEIAVSETELIEYFEDKQDEFSKKERRQIRQFILNDAEVAERAEAELKSGKTFGFVAKKFAKLEKLELDLGFVDRTDLPINEVANAVFSMPNSGIAPVVKTAFGWHFLEVIKIEKADKKTLEDVRALIIPIIQREKASDSLFELANRTEDSLGSGASLEEAAEEIGLNMRSISKIDRSGKAPNKKEAETIPSKIQFLEIAFSTELGTESLLIEVGEDGYFILRVDNIIEGTVPPLSSIQSKVTDAWMQNSQKKAAENLAKNLLEKLDSGSTIESVAMLQGEKVKIVGPLMRSGNQKLEQNVVEKLFTLELNAAGIARIDGGYQILQVQEIKMPDLNSESEALKKLTSELTSAFHDDLMAQFSEALRKEVGVSVNRKILDMAFEPGGYRANRN